MTVAVDFDDTLTEESPFPVTGRIRVDEVNRLIRLQKQGCKIVLWTGRKGKYLQEAIQKCSELGLAFDDIAPFKFVADVYIDSKALRSVKELKNVSNT